jgi:hypothetical protein
MKETLNSSETSVPTRATRRNNPEVIIRFYQFTYPVNRYHVLQVEDHRVHGQARNGSSSRQMKR